MLDSLPRAAWPRIIPFVLFMVLLAVRGNLPEEGGFIDPRWVYGISVLVVGASLVFFWRRYDELGRGSGLSFKHALLSIVLGVVVFQLWIVLTEPWMMTDKLMNMLFGTEDAGSATAGFIPVDDGQLRWDLIAVRWIGAALLVPVMEELFWRSFLMRWVDNPEFERVSPAEITVKAIILSTLVFMLAHTLWLGAIVAGLVYAWLYRYTRSLWAPILAHAVTNGVLGVWVVVTGQWAFW